MKFADLNLGAKRRKRHPVTLQIAGLEVTIDLRVLNPMEWSTAIQKAREYAISCGIAEPGETDDLYEFGLEVATLATACIDHESPEDSPRHYFADMSEILNAELLTRDAISLLYAHFVQWDEEQSARHLRLGDAEFLELVKRSWAGDHGPFCELRPGTQFSSFRSLAGLYLSLLQSSSVPSSSSPVQSQTPTATP